MLEVVLACDDNRVSRGSARRQEGCSRERERRTVVGEELLVLGDVLEDLERHVGARELKLDVVAAVVVDETGGPEQEAEALFALAPQDREVAPAALVAHLVVLLLGEVGDAAAQVDDLALLERPRREHADLDERARVAAELGGDRRRHRTAPRQAARVLVAVRLVEGDAAVGAEGDDVALGVVCEQGLVVPLLVERLDAGEVEERVEAVGDRDDALAELDHDEGEEDVSSLCGNGESMSCSTSWSAPLPTLPLHEASLPSPAGRAQPCRLARASLLLRPHGLRTALDLVPPREGSTDSPCRRAREPRQPPCRSCAARARSASSCPSRGRRGGAR